RLTQEEEDDLRGQLRAAEAREAAHQEAARSLLEANQRLSAQIDAQMAALAPDAAAEAAPAREQVRVTLAQMLLSDEPERRAISALFTEGRGAEALDRMEARARRFSQAADQPGADAQDRITASFAWREIGSLLQFSNSARSGAAYSEALRLNPLDSSAAAGLARTLIAQGDLANAQLAAEAARNNAVTLQQRAMGLHQLSEIARLQNDLPRAAAIAQEYVETMRRAEREEPGSWVAQNLSAALDQSATIASARGDWRAAQRFAEDALRIDQARLTEQPNDPVRRLYLAIAWGRLDAIRTNLGDAAGALAAREESVTRLRALLRDAPDFAMARHNFGVAATNLAIKRRNAGDFAAALQLLQEADQNFVWLTAMDPENVGYREAHASVLVMLAGENDPRIARPAMQRARALVATLPPAAASQTAARRRLEFNLAYANLSSIGLLAL
ncbi:MAG TPA: hypothetical protein PLS69_12935, partial [Terricaulis sp.]|nr:hypothetical protein [Terricaulis sp.]